MPGLHPLRNFAAALITLAILAPASLAQPLPPVPPPSEASPLERAETRRKIAEQQATVEVRDAITKAEQLARIDAKKAAQTLIQARLEINSRADLSAARKDSLHDQLTAAINGINRNVSKPATTLDPRMILRVEQNRKANEAAQAEAKEVQEAITGIAKDEADGRFADAKRKLEQLKQKYPNNASVVELADIGLVRDNLLAAKSRSDEMSRRFVAAMNNVEKSAMPLTSDMEFPKDWKELTARRERLLRVQIGAEEEALLQALETRITVPAKGQPFDEVIQTLSNTIGKNIYIDQRGFEALGLDMRKPVDMPAGVSARTALRAMLQTLGMTFVIRDKIIKVVTVEDARKNMMTRSYEIRDLIQSGGPFNGGATWGPYVDFLQTQKNAEALLDSIMMSVDPAAWSNRGGPASIVFHYPSMSIIVRGPSEVHYTLGQAIYGPSKRK